MRSRTEKTVLAGDGTRLYARETRGPNAAGTPIICANGIGVSTFFWRYLEEHFSATRPVIVWDYRGHGRSEFPRDLDALTIEENAADLIRVLDAFGHRRAIAAGHSMGCQVVYAFGHRYPERAAMLVPMLGAVGRPVHTFMDRERSSLVAFALGHAVATRVPGSIGRSQQRLLSHPVGRRVVSVIARQSGLVHPVHMRQEDLDNYLDHFGAFSPLVFFRMAEHMATHSAEHYLERLAAPTLVVAGTRDLFTPLHQSERAAARIPTSRLLVLDEGSHAALVEQPDAIHAAMEDCLARWEVDGEGAAAEQEASAA